MKKLNSILMLLMACLCVASCHSEKMEEEDVFTGRLSLASLNTLLDVDVDTAALARATVDISNYIVRITNEKTEVNKWVYSEMPEVVSLPVGAYSIQVSSAEAAEAGIEKPFYSGTQEFVIEKNKITEVETVVCKLANIRLSVKLDAKFLELASDDVVITFSLGEVSVAMGKTDWDKMAYLPASVEENSVRMNIKGTVDGELMDETYYMDHILKGYHHTVHITFDGVNEGMYKPSGGSVISVVVDGSTIMKDDIVAIHPGDEPSIDDFPNVTEPENPGGGGGELSIVGTNFNGAPFDIDGDPLEIGLDEERVELIVTLGAEAGLAHVYVTIDSETLTSDILNSVELSDNFDLAEPGNMEGALKGLGFPVKDEVVGQSSIEFNVTQFTGLLGLYGPASHNFIIKIADKDGSELTKTLKIKSVE